MNDLFDAGNEHYLKQEFKEARACYETVLQHVPDNPIVLHNHGLACTQLGDYLAALDSFNKAIEHRYPESYISRGAVHRTLGNYHQAMVDFGNAFMLSPRHASAYSNYGNTLREFGMPDVALPFLKVAQELDPNVPTFRLNESVAHLLKGDLTAGWEKYDARWFFDSKESFKPVFSGPEYDGSQNINGLTVLVYGEQGFGDCIQFVRYVKMLENLHAKVVLRVRQPLINLFRHNFPNVKVISDKDGTPEYHYHVPLLSLPKCFGTTIETIPYPDQYLTPVVHQMQFLPEKIKTRVGIQWGSNSVAFITRFRKIDLSKLLEIANDDIELVCLSFDISEEEKKLLAEHNVLIPDLGDFNQTGYIINHCDLVITVDTVTAHLSGALGVPTWVMLSEYAVDWRWFLHRTDSPFYSCVKLFRQKNNTWDNVIESIKSELKSIVDNK